MFVNIRQADGKKHGKFMIRNESYVWTIIATQFPSYHLSDSAEVSRVGKYVKKISHVKRQINDDPCKIIAPH